MTDTEKIIQQTIQALKSSGMLKKGKTPGFKKTEDLLYRYPILKEETSDKRILKLTDVLKQLESEELLYDVIPLLYFKRRSILDTSLEMGISTRTVTRQRKRLVGTIRDHMFPEDCLDEIFD